MPLKQSQITSFFKNQTIFLTGGSGFLGKILIEKLLRECEDMKKIYVLIRSKKNKTAEERFDELFSFACFDRLKTKNMSSLKKVSFVNGDCQLPSLGMSEQDVEVLIKETTCVIHAAANVKFDQTLKEASNNVRATRDILELAKKMLDLKVFVFVSTAYSNCLNSHIREDFYEPPMTADKLLAVVNAFDDDTLLAITPQILGKWPNTYIYTKSVAEDLMKSANLPITIIRPAIIFSTAAEPMPGWIDNLYGVCGIVVGAALGVIRSMNARLDATAHIIPADYVCNCILAGAWNRERTGSTTIYNFVGSEDAFLTWKTCEEKIEPHCWAAVSEKVLWYYCFKIRENKRWHKICVFFLHTVSAYIVDAVLFCLRKPTLAVKNYQRLSKTLDSISYFSTRNWEFDNENVMELWNDMNEDDKKLFQFDMKMFDWDNYLHDAVFGGRLHLLKDTPDTLPKGEAKLKKLFILHYTVLALLYFLLYKFIIFLIGFFF